MLNGDYFSVFSLPRKLWIEMSVLEQKFLQMSWKLHPDNFVNASEEEREHGLGNAELESVLRLLDGQLHLSLERALA